MKTLFQLFTAVFFLSACADDQPIPQINTTTELNSAIVESDWIISLFMDAERDETADYDGFSFKFLQDGTVMASIQNEKIKGTWSSEEHNDDTSELKLILQFDDVRLTELNDDWDFISFTNSQIELQDQSGGNGGTDKLNFKQK